MKKANLMHDLDLKNILALDIEPETELTPETVKYFDICAEKLGVIPNVLKAYAFHADKLAGFSGMYNDLMLGPSGLTKLEREMIAVVVSSVNKCVYCLVAHGAALRQLSGDPVWSELIAMNYRSAELTPKQRAICDFSVLLTESPAKVAQAERQALRDAGCSDREIWDIANVIGFFNMSNRVAIATDMVPNVEYHALAR